MSRKTSFIANAVIALVLGALSIAVFTTDLSSLYLSVDAPLYYGNRDQKNVSLMITVTEKSEYLSSVLEVLQTEDATATFFLNGNWVTDISNLSMLKKLANDYEIGNQGFEARSLKKLSAVKVREDIEKNHDAVVALTGVEMHLFSPYAGEFSKTTLKVAEELSYTTVLWSIDGKSSAQTADKVFERCTTNVKNGDIVLLTPTEATFSALPWIIEHYKNAGFSIVSISDNIMASAHSA